MPSAGNKATIGHGKETAGNARVSYLCGLHRRVAGTGHGAPLWTPGAAREGSALRHGSGIHQAGTFQEKRLPRWRKIPGVPIWACLTVALAIAGGILSQLWHSDDSTRVFDAADIVRTAAIVSGMVTVLLVYRMHRATERMQAETTRMHRAVLRVMEQLHEEFGLPGPGKPKARDRDAA